MTVNHSLTMAVRMASEADVERVETYEGNIEHYRENNYSHIPLPEDGLYYDIEADELKELDPLQYVFEDMPIINVLEHLLHYPFLLIESSLDYSDYKIITLSDVSKGQAKEAVYPIIAGLEVAFSSELKDYYSDDYGELIDRASEETCKYWNIATNNGVELHITEYMSLGELRRLVGEQEEIYTKLGISDRETLIEELRGLIKKFRNRIMHTQKTLVYNSDELEELLAGLRYAEEIIEASGNTVEGGDYGRYETRIRRR